MDGSCCKECKHADHIDANVYYCSLKDRVCYDDDGCNSYDRKNEPGESRIP